MEYYLILLSIKSLVAKHALCPNLKHLETRTGQRGEDGRKKPPMSSEKRCLYEILGLQIDCTADEIRTAYKKLALQRHPDKLVQSGLSQAEATASFQELVNAYEVLSDPKERAWYDSHRSQILFSDSNSVSNSVVPDLFSYFSNSVFSGYSDSGKGFYRVYADLFDKVYACELNFAKKLGLGLGSVKEAPVMGNLDSPYNQVTAFYNYWLGFCTVMDFCWVDQYDVMAGPNRKSRRVMEEENKKLRKKAKREYNETVRGLADFVKKRDKRVIDMQLKKKLEMEKKKEEERERRREMERERLERAKAYEEPEWAKIDEEEDFENGFGEEGEGQKSDEKEFYCVVCGKKFKSEKQWKNHEQSKKHREKVAELRGAFADELKEQVVEDVDEEEEDKNGVGVDIGMANNDELEEQFKDSFGLADGQNGNEAKSSDDGDHNNLDHDIHDRRVVGDGLGLDDEMSVLEAMLSGRRNRKKAASIYQPQAETEKNDNGTELNFMEYDSRKSSRRNKGGKKGRGKKFDAESTSIDADKTDDLTEENNGTESLERSEPSSHSFVENEAESNKDHLSENDRKMRNQAADKKGATKDTNTKSKNSSKGRKAKATAKNFGNGCDTCGEEFESRNQLHKHLGETGHASLKYR